MIKKLYVPKLYANRIKHQLHGVLSSRSLAFSFQAFVGASPTNSWALIVITTPSG